MTVRGPIFINLVFAEQLFVKDSYAEFHENPAKGLVDIRLQRERRAWPPHKAFYFVKNAWQCEHRRMDEKSVNLLWIKCKQKTAVDSKWNSFQTVAMFSY